MTVSWCNNLLLGNKLKQILIKKWFWSLCFIKLSFAVAFKPKWVIIGTRDNIETFSLNITYIYDANDNNEVVVWLTAKKWSFPLTISSVNVTTPAISCRFWPHLQIKSLMENFIFCAVIIVDNKRKFLQSCSLRTSVCDLMFLSLTIFNPSPNKAKKSLQPAFTCSK